MRTDFQSGTSITAAVVGSLNKPGLVPDEMLVREGPQRGRPFVKEKVSAAFDEFEERLKAGEKVPESPKRLGRPCWKRIASMLGLGVQELRSSELGYRQRVIDLAARYGLEPPSLKPLRFAEFSVIALAHRERELAAEGDDAREQQVATFAVTMEVIAAHCAADNDARSALTSAVAWAGTNSVDAPIGFLAEVKRAIGYLGRWDANEDLPLNPAHLLRYALARSGLSQERAGALAGLGQGVVANWIRGRCGPAGTHFKGVNRLDDVLELPRGSLVSRFRASRRQTRPRPVYNSTTYGKASQWRIQTPYCMHDWPEPLEAEFAQWTDFRTAALCPYGMKRPKGRLGAKTIAMHRDWLESLFGSWTTDLNPDIRIDRAEVTLALLVFPRMVYSRLAFALARAAAATGKEEGLLTRFEVDQVRWIKSLFDQETGWLTQMPQLADRLRPVIGLDGEVIISEADITRVRADWKAACAAARAEYIAMKTSHLKHVALSRDPHESVRPILLLDNPLSALAIICRGLHGDMVGLDPEPLAYASRDTSIFGILAQTGFRASTVEALNLEDLFFDAATDTWRLRVPTVRFKNGKNSPYFGKGPSRRDYYERDLLDSHGLYDALDHYLTNGRSPILGNRETRALFVVQPTNRPGPGKQKTSWCEPGRMTHAYLGRLIHGISGKYLRYDPESGDGIPGITSFPCHAIRHIIATGVLKEALRDPTPDADPWLLAADAIHDSVHTVSAYVQYLPRDRQAKLLTLLDRGLVDG